MDLLIGGMTSARRPGIPLMAGEDTGATANVETTVLPASKPAADPIPAGTVGNGEAGQPESGVTPPIRSVPPLELLMNTPPPVALLLLTMASRLFTAVRNGLPEVPTPGEE